MGGTDTITVIVPVLDGAAWLPACLRALADQQVRPHEVIVVDGGSVDGSAEVARRELATTGLHGEVVHNPGRTVGSNLAMGLARASGDVVCRLDVRAEPPDHYLADVRAALSRPGVVFAGGAVDPRPDGAGLVPRAVARAHRNRVLMGLASYRSRTCGRPAETVYLGGGRTSQLRAAGGWDPTLASNEDYDLAQRLRSIGTVWQIDDLAIGWRAPAGVVATWARLHGYGRGKVQFWRRTGRRPAARQWLALLAPPGGVGLVTVVALRRPCAALALVALAVGALAATDLTIEDPAPLGERLLSTGIGVAGAGAWWTGVVGELCRPHRPAAAEASAGGHGARVCHDRRTDASGTAGVVS